MNSSPRNTVVARLQTGEQSAHRIATLFAECFADEDAAISLADNGGGRWGVAIHFRALPDEAAVRTLVAAAAGAEAAKPLHFERVAARDWVRESLAGLQPVRAGRFIVHGAHDRADIAPNRIGIEIEAALAFGTGHHGTTRGCLVALDGICKALSKQRPLHVHLRMRAQKPHILDLGTGSGVLAIAVARALRTRALATDIDSEAVRAARENAWRNRAGPLVDVVQADGVAARRLRARAPFDLVFANILLGPLQRFAAPLTKLIAPGGRIILSGLLSAQGNAAIAAYGAKRGLALERRINLEGWTTLVFVRRRS
jgi:ribosomal protein L11 methyltransferase